MSTWRDVVSFPAPPAAETLLRWQRRLAYCVKLRNCPILAEYQTCRIVNELFKEHDVYRQGQVKRQVAVRIRHYVKAQCLCTDQTYGAYHATSTLDPYGTSSSPGSAETSSINNRRSDSRVKRSRQSRLTVQQAC